MKKEKIEIQKLNLFLEKEIEKVLKENINSEFETKKLNEIISSLLKFYEVKNYKEIADSYDLEKINEIEKKWIKNIKKSKKKDLIKEEKIHKRLM